MYSFRLNIGLLASLYFIVEIASIFVKNWSREIIRNNKFIQLPVSPQIICKYSKGVHEITFLLTQAIQGGMSIQIAY